MDRLARLVAFHAEDPADAFVRFALAMEYAKRGDDASALATFEALEAHDPAYVGLYYHLGKLYERLGRHADAAATYRRGIEAAGREGDRHARSELYTALMELDETDA